MPGTKPLHPTAEGASGHDLRCGVGQEGADDYSATMPSAPRSSVRGGSQDVPGAGPVDAPDPSPRTRPIVSALLGLEALLLAAAATYCFIGAADGAFDARFGNGLGVFLLLFAVALGVAARSILVKGRFGLGWGITWQLFQALVGASMLNAAMYWQGALGLVLSIVLFVMLTRLVKSTPIPRRGE